MFAYRVALEDIFQLSMYQQRSVERSLDASVPNPTFERGGSEAACASI